MRIRITNNSKHKIETSGALFDMAWRSQAEQVYISSQFMKPFIAWDSIPLQMATYLKTDTVRGHDSIEYKRSFVGETFATDGSEPWVNQSYIEWSFENPDLRKACDEQFARLGRHTGPH